MATMPALTADLYGTKHFGQNYAFMFSGYTCASIIGPMLAASVLAHTGSYLPAFPPQARLPAQDWFLVAATAFMANGKGAEAQRQKNKRRFSTHIDQKHLPQNNGNCRNQMRCGRIRKHAP